MEWCENSTWNIWRLIFLFLLLNINQARGASCSVSTIVGETTPQDEDQHNDGSKGASFLMYHRDYKVDCTCGKIYAWSYYIKETYGDVYFQVWRPEGGSFTLIGQNAVSTDVSMKRSTQTYNVATADQITTLDGDYLGLYFPNDAVVTYDNGQEYKEATVGALNVGNTYNWYSVNSGHNRDFGFHAKLTSGNSPSITNLDYSRTVNDQVSIGTEVVTLTVSDLDVDSVLTTSMTSTSSEFQFNTGTLKLTVSTTPSSGTYVLRFRVADECSQTDTGTVTVIVANSKPTIDNMPATMGIREDVTTETLLFTITTSDASPSDTVSCSLQSTSPSSTNFFIKKIPSSTSYGIYVKNGASLNYLSVKIYTLSVRCTDGKDNVDSTGYIFVIKNKPPTFSNLPASVSLSSKSTSSGASVFQVVTSDPEGDFVTSSMTMEPAGGPFEITSAGLIKTKSSLSGLTVPGYDLKITIKDNLNTAGPRTVTVKITDINSAPTISNLPFSTSVAENSARSTSLYQVSGLDVDSSQTLTYTVSITPTEGNSIFTLNSLTGLVSSSSTKSINYETLTSKSFKATVTVSDGTASVSGDLTIVISDVNEAPSFQNPVYYISGDEGGQGKSFGNPGFVVNDPDSGTALTYSIDCAEFVMNSLTGDVSLAVAYDLDENGKPSHVSCIVTVSDGELSGTANLHITINEVNDNSPQFGQRSYTFYMDSNSAVGYVVGSVKATDGDIGAFGVVTYTVEQSNLGNPYFGVSGDGNMYVMFSTSPLGDGVTLSFTCIVTDTGGLNDSASIVIIIPALTTQAPIPPTERYRTFWEDTRNIAWITSFFITIFGIGSFMIYGCYRYDMLKPLRNKLQECRDKIRKRKLQQSFEKNARKRKRNLSIGKAKNTKVQNKSYQMADYKIPAAIFQHR